MNKYSLLQSTQAGPFSNANKMIDFKISDNMILNPSQSFVQLVSHLDVTLQNVDPNVIHNFVIKSTTPNLTPLNTDLIRNCWLSGEKCGKLEDIRRVNVLQRNLYEISKNSSEKISQVNTMYQMNDYVNHELLSPFVEFQASGSIPSRYIDAHLRIPLSNLFELGQLQAIDTSKTGALTLHLELENSTYFKVEQKQSVNRFVNEGKLNDVNVQTTTFTTTATYASLEKSPYYVNQPLTLQFRRADASGNPIAQSQVTQEVYVTGIILDPITGVITLSLSAGTPALPANSSAFILITVEDSIYPQPAVMSILTAELGICESVGAKVSQDALEYFTWTTEEYSTGGQLSMNKIFEIEANAVNALVMFNKNTSNFISNKHDLKSYRLRIDNLDIYDRDIIVNKATTKENFIHDGLHYEALNRTFTNMGKPFKNLNMVSMAQEEMALQSRFNKNDLQIMVIGTPTPLTAVTKKLQVNLDAVTPIENVILFKQVVKGVKL